MLNTDRVSDTQPGVPSETPHDLYHSVFCQVDRYQFWRLSGVGADDASRGSAGVRVVFLDHVKNRFTCLA